MNPSRPDAIPVGAEAEIEELRCQVAALTSENARLRQAAESGSIPDTVFEASPLPIVAFDPDGVVTRWNPAAETLFGWGKEEAVGMRLPFVPADRQVEFQQLRQRALRGEVFTEPELHRRTADGSPIVVSESIAPLRRPDGTICGILSILADVTDRKVADESLERLSMVVAQADESILITDPCGVVQYVNPAFERTAGFGLLEVLGRNPKIFKSELHDGEFYRNLWKTIESGAAWRGKFTNRRKDGTLCEEDAVIFPVRDRAGRILNYVKMSRPPLSPESPSGRTGEPPGEVTHDFNNLLTAISGYCDLLLHRVPESSELRKDVEQIRKAGDRAAELTRKLSAHNRRHHLCRKEPDLSRSMIPSRGAETVLLVEDEELVRLPARDILRRCGYTVLDAGNGREALLLSEAHRGTIHLMLTDLVMPRMDGQELAERMRLLRPDTRVLFMSGYPNDDVARPDHPENGSAFLRKPFTAQALSLKVREILDAS